MNRNKIIIFLIGSLLFSHNILCQNAIPQNMLNPAFLLQATQSKNKFYIVNQSLNSFFKKKINLNENINTDSTLYIYEFLSNGNMIKKLAEADFYRTFFSICILNNKIYIAGGYDNKGIPSKSLFEYDLASHKWSEKTEMFYARTKFALECINGKLYAIGGEGIKPSIEYYTPENDLWEIIDFKLIPSNTKPIDTIAASAVIEDKIYLLNYNGSVFQIFTPNQNLLSEGPSTPIKSNYFDMLAVNKKLYVAAGVTQTSIDNKIYLYDAVEGVWSITGNIPLPRFGSALAYFNKAIIFIGGSTNTNIQSIVPTNEIYLYRPMK